MFKKFMATMVVVATLLCGCSTELFKSNEEFVIEDYSGCATMTARRQDDGYVVDIELTEEGCVEAFGEAYGDKVTGMTYTMYVTQDGYDYIVNDLEEQGYEFFMK